MAIVLAGAAGAAFALGALSLMSQPARQEEQQDEADELGLAGEEVSPYPSIHESRHASPNWQDQHWQLDCGEKESCEGFRTPGDGMTPFNVGVPQAPLWGQVQDRTVHDLGEHEVGAGSFLDDIRHEGERDASVELEMPPEHTVSYTTHPLAYGGQLMPHELPYGASEATDLQFWGPENWDSYRHSKRPTYLDNLTIYKDGKEINRPLDDFGPKWDTAEGGPGAHEWGIGAGEFTARDATPRMLSLNRYGSAVTTRSYERPKFLPPTPGGAPGGGNPGLEPEVTFGERVNRLFAAFSPWKAATCQAPPEMADVTLQKSRRLLYNPEMGVAAARYGQQSYGGPGVNPVDGGRMRQADDALSLPQGNVKPKVAAGWNLDINPYQGYHYTGRETLEGPAVGRRGQGGNGYLLLGPNEEYRPVKVPSDLQEYVPPKGGSKTGTYGGEAAHGIMIPNVRSESLESMLKITGKGGHGQLGKAGIVTLHHNAALSTRGADYDDSPIPDQLINLRTPLAKAMQVGGRSQAALDDLFDVQHS